MMHINAPQLAINLLNSTLGIEDIPLEVHGRIATALMLLDTQEGEDFYGAIRDAYEFLGKDTAELEEFLSSWEDSDAD